MSSHDVLAIMLKELQISGSQLDHSDTDARAAWISACAVALSGIQDPAARLSQLMNFAIILTVTCMDLPSAVAFQLLARQVVAQQPKEER